MSLTGLPQSVSDIVARIAAENPDLDSHLCAIDAISGFDWRIEWLSPSLNGLTRQAEIAKWRAHGGDFPAWSNHNELTWTLYYIANSGTALYAHWEHSIRIDGGMKRADLTLSVSEWGDQDVIGVVEVKSRIDNNYQLRAAVDQVLRYCLAFAALGPAPTPVVVAGKVKDGLPRMYRGVRVLSPPEYVSVYLPAIEARALEAAA